VPFLKVPIKRLGTGKDSACDGERATQLGILSKCAQQILMKVTKVMLAKKHKKNYSPRRRACTHLLRPANFLVVQPNGDLTWSHNTTHFESHEIFPQKGATDSFDLVINKRSRSATQHINAAGLQSDASRTKLENLG
jgi:hypothetical protein